MRLQSAFGLGNNTVQNPRSRCRFVFLRVSQYNRQMQGRLLLTGAAGFIGSEFCNRALARGYAVTAFDALTYAGHFVSLAPLERHPGFRFVHADIRDLDLVRDILHEDRITAVVHMAAESHVDNSIAGPRAFLETNVLGTFSLLEAVRTHLAAHPELRDMFRFVHVSTDEVFGALGDTGAFTEKTAYDPRSPYSASKAASDHLARAWWHTYKLPTIVTNCSNNYGPRQFPEKLIPVMIRQALRGADLPVYGLGLNIRDWIHVSDHCDGILLALEKGAIGSTYCFGGRSERRNIDVVEAICTILDKERPRASGSYRDQIRFVEDRLGHDWRYAIDSARAESELGFHRTYSSFEAGLADTVRWYLNNEKWVAAVMAERASS